MRRSIRAVGAGGPERSRASTRYGCALDAAHRMTVPLRTVLAMAAALTVALLLLVAAAPGARAADGPCVADSATGCLNGTLRTSAGDPVVGASVTASGPAGELSTTTDADGRWWFTLTEPGDYTVILDPTTLPPGETLRDPAATSRTVTVALGSSAGALFPLGPPAAAGSSTPSTTPSVGTGDGASQQPSPDADGVGAPVGSGGSGIGWGRVAQQATSGLVFGLLLALASVGLSLIYGTTGLSNFAHGEQVTLGGVTAYAGSQLLGLPLVVAGTLAVVVGAITGWLQDAAIWRPLRRRHVGPTQQMIVTIGLSMALQYLFQLLLGGGALRIVTANPSMVSWGPVRISQASLWSAGIAVVVLGAVAYGLVGTRVGRATRAVSDNPALAAASGISVNRIIRLVWTVGAALAAIGGVLMGLYLNATSWNMGGALLLLMFAAVTLGGLGAAFGALAGSIVIGLVVELSNLVIPSDMRYAAALVILILVLLLRPQGILGRAERVG